MNRSTPGLPVHHQLPEFTQTHVHRVGDAIQPSHPLSSPSPPALNLSQHQGLFKWVSSSHQVAKVLEFQLQHQSFQWTPRTDILLDCEKSWAWKNLCFWTVVLEKTLENPLDSKKIKPVNRKGNQPWIFIGRTDAETETPMLWPHDTKNWLIWKDPDAGKDWRQEDKGMTEDEMVGWHHWFDGCEFEQVPGVGDGQGSLVCCSPWGRKESDTTERLNWLTEQHYEVDTIFSPMQ